MDSRKYLFAFLALGFAASAGADAFKCRAPGGGIVISSAPCQEGSQTLSVKAADQVSPEQRLQARQDLERQRNHLAEVDADRAAEERREQDSRRKLAEEDSARQTACLNSAQREPDPQYRADLIAACNGVAPQRQIVQQPVYVPAAQVRQHSHSHNRPAPTCLSGNCSDIYRQQKPSSPFAGPAPQRPKETPSARMP